jgi:hypothetical protein
MQRTYSVTALLALLALAPVSARADQQTGPQQSARALISQFRASTGADVSIGDGIDLDQPVANPSRLAASRQDLMDSVASAVNAVWTKTWVVTAATSLRPLADADYLRSVVNSAGTVTFDASSLTAADAIRTAAKADNADVRIVGSLPVTNVSLSGTDLSVADAIAAVSRATKTSWSLSYTLTRKTSEPRFVPTADSPKYFHMRQSDRDQLAIANQEAPLTIHFQYPSTGPDPRVMGQDQNTNAIGFGLGPSIITPVQPLGYLGGYGNSLSGNYTYVDGYGANGNATTLGGSFGPTVSTTPSIGTTITPTVTPMAVQPTNSTTVVGTQTTTTTTTTGQ